MMPRPAELEKIPQRATGLKRVLYIVVGMICVGLAVVGALLPGIPTTPWVLLASYCFARSSARLDRWLRNAPIFGKLIRDWNQYRGVDRRLKIRAVCFVVVVVSLSITFSPLPVWAKIIIGCWAIIGICTILFVVPTIKRASETIDKYREGCDMMETLPERVQRVLRTEVAAALMLDGAELEVLDVSDGIARVRFGGACASCPATILTLITGLEAELRKHVPEVEYIEATI